MVYAISLNADALLIGFFGLSTVLFANEYSSELIDLEEIDWESNFVYNIIDNFVYTVR